MHQRPTVLLLIPHLGGGGAERVTALLARGLSALKYDLHLGLITQSLSASDLVPAWVTIHSLGAHRVRSAAVPLLRLVQEIKPDLILSGMAHLNFLVLLLRPLFPRKTRIVVRQNATVSSALRAGQLPTYSRLLYRLLYPAADRVVCQTAGMAADLAARSRLREARLRVLPNPVDVDAIRACRSERALPWSGLGPHLLAVGRLSKEKGFDLLLGALRSLRVRFPSAELTILGTGPEESALKSMRDVLRLETAVHFAGYVPRPEVYFAGAALFVLPSRYEGLPNAMLEAAAGGLPIVALPCSEGVVNLLWGRPGAWLGSEVSSRALSNALLDALNSIQSGERFPHPWVQPFRMDQAIDEYERLIDETLLETRA